MTQHDPSSEVLDSAHVQRALELVQLSLEDRKDEARLMLETVPTFDLHPLSAAVIALAVTVCEAAGREFTQAIIEEIQEVRDA